MDITSLACPKVEGVRVLGKCEFLNPGFSMKDRIVKNIFDKVLIWDFLPFCCNQT